MTPAPEKNEATGLPILRSWRAVYVFVLILFVLDIALLILLERKFS